MIATKDCDMAPHRSSPTFQVGLRVQWKRLLKVGDSVA